MTKKELLNEYGEQLKILGVNLNVTTKEDLLSIINFRCQHKHSPFTHPKCYRKIDGGAIEKIACLDIETSNLQANFGIILSWVIKTVGGSYSKDVIKQGDKLDCQIVKSCVNALCKFNRVVGHYSTYFDIPFLRTRALYWGIDFPEYGSIYHTDV